LEASNLVGQLREEFVKTTTRFKDVLKKRSDRMRMKHVARIENDASLVERTKNASISCP
jgi:hypothetical protein